MESKDKNPVEQPHVGMSSWKNRHGITVLRLHYSADPEKGEGSTTYVPEINKHLSPWALAAYGRMTDPTLYLKEYEIDAESALGALLFNFDEKISVEETRAIPPEWTRRMAIDPHPSVPHAFLWCATDPWGDRWYYRELWPSKIAYEWRGGVLHGLDGPCRQDEKGPNIREYVQTIKYLESSDNPENIHKGDRFDEEIFARVIDYAARSFGKGTADDPEQENYQQRYEKHLIDLEVSRPFFDDAKKDRQVGIELVNEGFKKIERMSNGGEYEPTSRIHILGERCPELIHQLKSNRRQMLTPLQVGRQDPTGKPVKVRNHMTDCLVAGTLITTENGLMPIESIPIGTKVLTRSGWKRVTDNWLANSNAQVIEVSFSNGALLRGTRDHRVLGEDGKWINLGNLIPGAMCMSIASNSTGASIVATPILSMPATDATSKWASIICTAISGLRQMGRSLRAITFTTAMATGSTMTSRISSQNRAQSILPSMDDPEINPDIAPSLPTSGHLPLHGTPPHRGGNGIANMAKRFGRMSRFAHWCAAFVANNSKPRNFPMLSFAGMPVKQPLAVQPAPTMRIEPALSAIECSPSVNIRQYAPVHDCVVAVRASSRAGIAAVYDLTVEDSHEFYANGILVHNCLRYIEMSNPIYIERESPMRGDSFTPLVRGFSY